MLYFDFETTNIRKGTALDSANRIVMVSWAEDGSLVKNYTGDIMSAYDFWAALSRHDTFCAYNCKFEAHWLKRCGYDIDSVKWCDPMLGEKVLLGNTQLRMSLGAVCGRYGLPTKDVLIDSLMSCGVCPSEMPQHRLRQRCNRDVRSMRVLHGLTMDKLHDRDQVHLYRNRCDFAVVLTHIEAEGMQLDADAVADTYATYAFDVCAIKGKLDELTGGINLNSPLQKAEFLYDTHKFQERKGAKGKPLRTQAGGRMTDKITMQHLLANATTKRQREFAEKQMAYSKAHAAMSKNLEFFYGVCAEYGSKFHAQFNQTVAATHRLTSSGMPLEFKIYNKKKSVQFQNMPREFKGLFSAPEGYLIAEIDAMQLEFRVAAFVGNDEQARKDIDDPDFDAHCRTAAALADLPYEDFLRRYREGRKHYKTARQNAKADTFKPLYGGTKGTPAQERYYAQFRERYRGLNCAQESWLADVMRTGKHRTAWGMEFQWETYMKRDVAFDKRTHKPVGPQVFNYPVQNLATAEIVPIAIVALYKRCKELELDVKFVNTIHDSVIVYVKNDIATLAFFKDAASWAFTTAVYEHLRMFYNIEFDVPLGMEMVIGDHWNTGTKHVYDDVDNWKERENG